MRETPPLAYTDLLYSSDLFEHDLELCVSPKAFLKAA